MLKSLSFLQHKLDDPVGGAEEGNIRVTTSLISLGESAGAGAKYRQQGSSTGGTSYF